ncbi:MAG: family 78 glycoside hydrolase catalytic domain, partial [Clostridia bacterium]|nr:family 78 glycoside hydrolase catalytic domain [Clostridia bacterium]
MLKIRKFACEHLTQGCVTDERTPRFSFSVDSDRQGTAIQKAVISVNGWSTETTRQADIAYAGQPLKPFTAYEAKLSVIDGEGNEARASMSFETGRFDLPWSAKWITDGGYRFTEKGVSPKPLTFRKKLKLRENVASARIYATALGVYELDIDGQKVGSQYFAPGFTSYKHNLQYQAYDVTDMLKNHGGMLTAVISGGWAVGSFLFTRRNRYAADRQALLLEVRVAYADGTIDVIGTDATWQVTQDGPVRMADLYDGETYDATADLSNAEWRSATIENLRIAPRIAAQYGAPVIAHGELSPVAMHKSGKETIYDFGQNIAGVVRLSLRGKAGQIVTVRHAEILKEDGSLNTAFLRTAKATVTYTCRDGQQVYSPRFTYMGFRYVAVSGIRDASVRVSAVPLYSDIEEVGGFECSDPLLNRLQQNILWSARSNFVDIPTDCPQRDERMGWTGDIAVFAPTACFNFDMSRFLNKWLADVRAEQGRGGGIPCTVPAHFLSVPYVMPRMAVDWWGDACVLVPWAEYQATGEERFLRDNYATMKKYVDACRFWAGLGLGQHRYIWRTPSIFHFGDWVAPDVKPRQWQARAKWTATASLQHTSALLSRIAGVIGEIEDCEAYAQLSRSVASAYRGVFTDGRGRLRREFQTAYALPLCFGIFPAGEERQAAAANLAALVEKNEWRIGTGFPGTPFILFALADNGQKNAAFRMLMNTKRPSWLYEVKAGAT